MLKFIADVVVDGYPSFFQFEKFNDEYENWVEFDGMSL